MEMLPPGPTKGQVILKQLAFGWPLKWKLPSGICLLATASVPARQMALGTISDRELSVT